MIYIIMLSYFIKFYLDSFCPKYLFGTQLASITLEWMNILNVWTLNLKWPCRWLSTAVVQQIRLKNLSPQGVLQLKSVSVIDPFSPSSHAPSLDQAVYDIHEFRGKHSRTKVQQQQQEEEDQSRVQGGKEHFHVSLFKGREIGPMESSGLSVVFLPRTTGPIRASFVVETNLGRLMYLLFGSILLWINFNVTRYHAKGYGIPNPYLLQPISGIKVPFGYPYSPSISLYNPRPYPIKV